MKYIYFVFLFLFNASAFAEEVPIGGGMSVVRPDGKVVVSVDYDILADGLAILTCQYNPDGTKDLAFAHAGCALYREKDSSLGDLALNGDKLVIAGYTGGAGIIQYNNDGSLDQSFANRGLYKYKPEHARSGSSFKSVSISPTGAIDAVASYNYPLSDPNGMWALDALLVRLTGGGELDPSLAGKGFARYRSQPAEGGYTHPQSMLRQADGKLVVTGDYSPDSFDHSLIAIRINPDGTLDQSFGYEGVALHPLPPSFSSALMVKGIVEAPDHSLVFSYDWEEHHNIARLFPDGSRDLTFGNAPDGNLEVSGFNPLTLNALPDGNILVGGARRKNDEDYHALSFLKLSPEGTLLESSESIPTPQNLDVWQDYRLNLLADGSFWFGYSIEENTGRGKPVLSKFNAKYEIDRTIGEQGFLLIDK